MSIRTQRARTVHSGRVLRTTTGLPWARTRTSATGPGHPASSQRDELVLVRPATADDLPAMAGWHCRHLPHGLFPRLGAGFVRRWHATFLDSAYGVALVAELADPAGPRPVGFLVGSSDQARHVDTVIRRHRVGLGIAGLVALLLRPRTCLHFLRSRSAAYARRLVRSVLPHRRRDGTGAPDADGAPRVAVITAVVVDPGARGAGAGEALVRTFSRLAGEAGAPEAQLVTMSGPAGAGQFYARLGWEPAGEHRTRDGAVVRVYRLPLPAAGPAPAEDSARDRRPASGS